LLHGSHHYHEVTVVCSSAQQVWSNSGQVRLREGTRRKDVQDIATLGNNMQQLD